MPVNSGTTFMLKMRTTDTARASVNLFFQGSPNNTNFRQGRVFTGRFSAAQTADILPSGVYAATSAKLRIGATYPPPTVSDATIIFNGAVGRAGDIWSSQTGYQAQTFLDSEGRLVVFVNTLNEDPSLLFCQADFVGGFGGYQIDLSYNGIAETAINSPVIVDTQPVAVSMIQSSQTGSPIHVFSIGIDVVAGIQGSMQFSEPINISRFDLNGNVRSYVQFGVIDPYQPQTKTIYDVNTSGLVLDGQTQFNYTLDALTTVELFFKYVNVKSMQEFGWAVRQRIFEEMTNQSAQLFIDSPGLTKHVTLRN